MKSISFFIITASCLKKAECLSWRQILGGGSPFSFDPAPAAASVRPVSISPTIPRKFMEETQVNDIADALQTGISSTSAKLREQLGMNELPTGPTPHEEEKEEDVEKNQDFMSSKLQSGSETFSEVSPANIDSTAEEKKEANEFRKDILETMKNPGKSSKFSADEIAALKKDFSTSDVTEECIKDYSQQCPQNFSSSSNLCIALSTYKGPCSKVQKDLYKFSDEQKKIWASACEADFPCMPKQCPNGTNYRRQCPVGWLSYADGTCSAPTGYEGCDNAISLKGATNEMKASLEKSCGIRWPCMPAFCPRDFSRSCPDGWEETFDKRCKAPSSYSGPCPQFASIRDFVGSSEKKFSFEQKCLVSWPCLDGIRGRDRDYDAACPLGWIELNNGFCQSPSSFLATSRCPDQISFDNATASEKESFALLCNVDFPFKERGNCKRDFTSRCPIGWIEVNDGVNCQAADSYAGKCERISAYGKLDDAKKQEKMRSCDVDWPCLGEWTEGFQIQVSKDSDKKKRSQIHGEVRGPVGESGKISLIQSQN